MVAEAWQEEQVAAVATLTAEDCAQQLAVADACRLNGVTRADLVGASDLVDQSA